MLLFRGARRFLCRFPREERGLARDPRREARTGEDALDVSNGARIAVRIDLRIGVAEIGEWPRDRDVGQGQTITDEVTVITGNSTLEIVEDRRQVVELGLARRLGVPGLAQKARRDDQVEEDPGAARDEDRVREFLESDRLAARFRLGRNERRLREFRFEIMNDRA